MNEFTAKYKAAFFDDINTLGIEPAEIYPAATEHIPEMVELVKKLLDKGIGYRGEDGSIYYSIQKFPQYGKLSGKRPDKLIACARISHDEYEKDNWADFALWKAWNENDGDIFWETEIGKGRPGWHIECSAMSMKYLGETFDIHTGGEDNIFPHHENEIAQSEAVTGKPFVKYWLHCAHLIVEGKKMSKSLGNFFTLRDLLDKGFNPLAIRCLLISSHYRMGLNFTFDGLSAAQSSIDRIVEYKNLLHEFKHKGDIGTYQQVTTILDKALKGFEDAMDDDLNISRALASIFEMIRNINRIAQEEGLTEVDAEAALNLLDRIDSVLGILSEEERELTQEMKELIAEREIARKQKDWSKSDAIRKKLLKMGIELKDTLDGTKWKWK